jgi:hypothetical protein
VLRRMLNVAVRKRLLTSNPCAMVEFPVTLKGLFRPHYVTWSEQQQIENRAMSEAFRRGRIALNPAVSKCGAGQPRKVCQLKLSQKQGFTPDDRKAKERILESAEML